MKARVCVNLERHQIEELRRVSKETDLGISAIVRFAVDYVLRNKMYSEQLAIDFDRKKER